MLKQRLILPAAPTRTVARLEDSRPSALLETHLTTPPAPPSTSPLATITAAGRASLAPLSARALKVPAAPTKLVPQVGTHASAADEPRVRNGIDWLLAAASRIEAAEADLAALENRGYDRARLLMLLSWPKGAQAIRALRQFSLHLGNLGYTTEDLVQLAGTSHGARILQHLQRSTTTLLELGFSAQTLVRIGRCDNGKSTLDTLQSAASGLKAAGFTIDELADIAAHEAGFLALSSLLHQHIHLRKAGFTQDDLVLAYACRPGCEAMTVFMPRLQCLQKMGYTPAQIVMFARETHLTQDLMMRFNLIQSLIAEGFCEESVMRISKQPQGYVALTHLLAQIPSLRLLGLRRSMFSAMLCNTPSPKNLRLQIKLIVDAINYGIEVTQALLFDGSDDGLSALHARLDA